MVSQASGNSGGPLNPAMRMLASQEFEAQGFVGITEIVKAADNVHTSGERVRLVSQHTRATG
jgi:hypothetical protein